MKRDYLMTPKKYILTYIIFFVLVVSTLIFLVFSLKATNIFAFYGFTIAACISFVSALLFIILNYKKLIAYEAVRVANKIKDLDFSVIEVSINEKEIQEKVKIFGYAKTAEHFYHKKMETDVGDGIVIDHYYIALLHIEQTIDIFKCLEKFSKGMTTYNIGYIFVDENLEKNLEMIKQYIKETVVDIEIHRHGYKKFFSPIVISANKIYYLQAGSFFNEYKKGIIEGLRILEEYLMKKGII